MAAMVAFHLPFAPARHAARLHAGKAVAVAVAVAVVVAVVLDRRRIRLRGGHRHVHLVDALL